MYKNEKKNVKLHGKMYLILSNIIMNKNSYKLQLVNR